MGAFKMLRGRSSPSSINFGTKTRLGYGGRPVSETANTALSGTYGAYFKVDDLSHIVPAASGAGTYGNAWTPPPGQSSVTVTGASATAYMITLLAGAAHIRERTTTPGAVNQDSASSNQLRNMLANASWIDAGQTIWCRDGPLNPAADFGIAGLDPVPIASRGGSGRLTVRSETVDTSVDQWGWPKRLHGFRIGRTYLSPSGTTALALDWVDVSWYCNDATAIGSDMTLFGCDNSATWSDMKTLNCGFSFGPLVTDVTNLKSIGALQESAVVDHCTFYHVGGGISFAGSTTFNVAGKGNLPTATNNIGYNIRDDDFIDIGTNTWGWLIKGNVVFDILALSGGHCDFLQTPFLGSPGMAAPMPSLGEVSENICIGPSAQGVFMGDIDVNTRWTGGKIGPNFFLGGGNQVLACAVNGVEVVGNVAIAPEASLTTGIIAIGSAVDATARLNITNSMNYTDGTTPVSGTVTKTPDPQIVLAQTTAAYQAKFPGYVAVPTDFSMAGITALATPTVAIYAAMSQSGAFDPTGAWNPLA